MTPHEPTEDEIALWLSRCPHPSATPADRSRYQGVSPYGTTPEQNTAQVRRETVIAAIRAGHEPWGKTGGTA